MASLQVKENDNKRLSLITAPQTLTANFADLGTYEINCMDVKSLSFWFDLDINNSTGVQFRVLGRCNEDATWYELPIESVAATKVTVAPYIEEFSNNLDQKIVIPFDVADTIPFIKVQIKATVVGATAGQMLSAYVVGQTARYGL